jgi:hypothetical protein
MMEKSEKKLISRAKEAALEVLLHNVHGPYRGLPRTAGWGYPEPYTRDLMICSLGILASHNKKLLKSFQKVLETCANNQSPRGHIPSLVHDSQDRGASDTTPLFLMATALYRKVTGDNDFLTDAVSRSMTWMKYQSPSDRYLVGQLPTSDWRDEMWVLGYGLYVNCITYMYLTLMGENEPAENIRELMGRFTVKAEKQNRHIHEGLVLKHKPYYAMWSYKVYQSERFDLLGNSLAIISGIAPVSRAKEIVHWVEHESQALRENGDLAVGLPPNYFPFCRPGDADWRERYQVYNQPGEYHNGGVWPFVCGFYIAALTAAGRFNLAGKKLVALARLVEHARAADVEFGFNEWHKAQDGTPQGQDWQSWSAAMFLYAAACVEQRKTPFFDEIRSLSKDTNQDDT